MRILHLEAGRHLYGGARQAGYLIDALAARGIENLLVCSEGHALTTSNARVYAWPLGGDLDVFLYHRLLDLLRKEQPDLVHVHSRRGADTFGGRAARAAGIPAVLTRRVQSTEPGFWLRLKCRPYAAIAAISSAVLAELEAAELADERLRLIRSAVDTARFRPDPRARGGLVDRYALPADALIVGAASQLIPRKGLDRLLPLTETVLEGAPRFRLLVFGQGVAYRGLAREVRRRGLDGRVVFAGFVPEWPDLVPGLDLLLHPARREGLGAAVLEAMSAGVPVVASAAGGIVDIIDDGVDGRLVPPDDSGAWHEAVLGLVNDRAERAQLGAAARQKVEARFTIERMTTSYIALYEEILRRDGG